LKGKTTTDGSISIDTGTDELPCAIRDRVAVITLNRPEARNSLSDHCEALGLVNRVVPDVNLQSEAFGIARTLANGPGSAFASIKDNLDLALSADFLTSLDHEAEKMVAAASTAQHTEAVRAFIEKRAPSYR